MWCAAGAQRDRAHDQRDAVVAVGADLDVAVGAAAEHRAQRLLVGTPPRRHQVAHQVGQQQPGQVAGEPEPAVDRLGVGAGVDDVARLVDAQEAVADAR